ncbi:MAG: ROK family protein [Deltaproteobacteria bacterium]|nr:ROK family protein [Deltaproteobacteria bacterium]
MRIGVDLGGTKIEAVVMDVRGRVRARRRVPTPAGDYPATLREIASIVEELEAEVAAQCTVGIGTPGARSPATGRMKNCNSTCLNGQPLLEDLQQALRRPVRMANDADCFALSEATDGAGAGAGVVFAAILGTGVGGGLVVGRQLVQGPNAIAGEWGHNPLPWPAADERPGPACYCGRAGCVETFLSGPGFRHDFARHGGQDAPAEEIMALCHAGVAAARDAYGRYVDRLARSLASVINVVDPHVIVLGGGLSNIHELYRDIPARWSAYVFSDRVDTRLAPAAHGDASGVRGAAWLWPAEA